MKFKNTFLLLILAGVLFAFVYFYERKTKSTSEAREAEGRIVEVDRDKINAVTIKNPETTIQLQKRDNQWFIEKPVKDRADSLVVSQLFTTLESLKRTAELGADKDQVKEYGLLDPGTSIVLNGEKAKPVEVDLGKDAAVEGKVYAMVAGENKVEVISNDLKTQLSKKTDDFRDRKLADLTTQQLSKVDVKSGATEVELERKNNHWSILKPLAARGNDSKINDLISQAVTAHVDQFLPDGDLATYGLAEPRGAFTFTVTGSDKPVTLQVGASPKDEKEKDKTYVKLSSRDGLALVSKTSMNGLLEAKPNDIRDRSVVRFESDIVDRVGIEPAGGPKLTLARKGESWVQKDNGKDLPINEAAAKRLINDLQGAQVTNFVADVATELPKYGLDQPSLKVTLSSYASENTAETKAGEKPIVTLLFGKVEGNDVYVKLDDEPFVLSTAKTILDAIPSNAIQWQDLTIFKNKPADIASFDRLKAGEPAMSLQRDKESGWKLAKGDGTVNKPNADTLVSALAGLRAARWEGPLNAAAQGLDKPVLVIDFNVQQGDKSSKGKLTVGSATPDELHYATADGANGVFLINRPDFDALNAALTDKESAPKTPPPAPSTPATGKATGSPEPTPIPAPAAPATTTPPANTTPPAAAVPAASAPGSAGAPPASATAPASKEPAPNAPAAPASPPPAADGATPPPPAK